MYNQISHFHKDDIFKNAACLYTCVISELIDSTHRRWAVSAPQRWPVIMTSGWHNVHGSWWQLLLEHCLKRHCVGGLGYSFRYDVPNPDGPWEKAVYTYICQGADGGGRIDQSHRYGRPQAACREPAGSYDKTTRTAICFEHKTQYLLIRAPYTRIVVFWHISNIPPMISQSQISCNTPTFYIAAIFVKYYYTTGSWLL